MERSVRFVLVTLFSSAVALAALAQAPPMPKLPPMSPPTAATEATPKPGEPAVAGKKSWVPENQEEWLKLYYRIFQIPKSEGTIVGPNRVKVAHPLSSTFELVREDASSYYIRNLPLEDPDSPMHNTWAQMQALEIRKQALDDYIADKYLIVDGDDIYPPFTDRLDFTRRDKGLPVGGRFQVSFDVADMNGDGLPDLVLPPQRTGQPVPAIFLQQKDGSWKQWADVRWPSPDAVSLDYGAVRVADFDGDGHLDIAIASHFKPAYVLYGNGKGDFSRAVRLPELGKGVTARSLTVADFNGDGRPDVAMLAELDIQMGTYEQHGSGLVNVVLNLPGGWRATGAGFPAELMGDGLSAGDLDGDGRPDLVLTSLKQGVRNVTFRNVDKAAKWEEIANLQMPYNAFVTANAIGSLDRFGNQDTVMCFEQINPRVPELPTQACTVYHYHGADGKRSLTPTAKLFLKEKKAFENVRGIAIGDIDGDGRNDIALVTVSGKVRVFLQFPDGELYEQRSPLFDLGDTTYAEGIRIADLRHRGMGDIIVIGSPSGVKPGGGVWVFSPEKKGHVPRKATR